MKSFEVHISKGMYKVWTTDITVKGDTADQATEKALQLAKKYPEGKIRERTSEPIVWEEGMDDEDYKFQVEDVEEQ